MNYRAFSDSNLLEEIRTQVKTEREAGIAVLKSLREIEKRRLHLKMGFGSLHEFLVQDLRYSDGAAHRRLNAMRLLKELPEIEEKLSEGTVSLTTASQLQDFFRAESVRCAPVASAQKLELLESITGKSSRETQALLAELSPQSAMPERVQMLSQEEVLIQLKLSKEVLEKLDELKALLAHGLTSVNGYGELIAKLAEKVLREEKRKRGITDHNATKGKKALEHPVERATASAPKLSSPPDKRFPSLQLKKTIYQRAQGQCEYLAPKTAKRCHSRFALEIDHIQAWEDGGKTDLENLRLLCSAHHRDKTRERNRI